MRNGNLITPLTKVLEQSINYETMRNHLRNMVEEHYGIFMREGFASIEFAEEFIEAAKAIGHNGEARAAERWIEQQKESA